MILSRRSKKGEPRYLVRVYVGLSEGQQGRKYVFRQFKRKKDAEQWEREQELAKGKGALVLPSNQTVRDYLRAWLDGPKKAEVRESTLQDYEEALGRAGLLPDPRRRAHALALRALTDVNRDVLKAFYAELATKGMPQAGCGPLGPRSIRFIHGLLYAALNEAVARRVLYANPAAGLKLPAQTQKPRNTVHAEEEGGRIHALTGDEVNRLLAAAAAPPQPRAGVRRNGWKWRYTPPGERNRWWALLHLLAKGGLRPSEALGMTYADVDWAKGAVRVRHTLKTGLKGGGWKLEEPKTQESRRIVALPPDSMAALRQHCDATAAEVATMTAEEQAARQDRGFLFASRTGAPLDLKNISARHFKPLLRAIGLPSIRLYDLRHTHATLMLTAGVSVHVVSKRLGHKSAKMTLDVYSHVLPGQQEEAVAKLEALLGTSA